MYNIPWSSHFRRKLTIFDALFNSFIILPLSDRNSFRAVIKVATCNAFHLSEKYKTYLSHKKKIIDFETYAIRKFNILQIFQIENSNLCISKNGKQPRKMLVQIAFENNPVTCTGWTPNGYDV